ncbi:MAG TPA: magnesium/cobalt transporter CorA [Candidatus Brocadiia bacterium]|nr:magnesium/cobalt transporter CorA [Candidatus Brocadiia bacterium]
MLNFDVHNLKNKTVAGASAGSEDRQATVARVAVFRYDPEGYEEINPATCADCERVRQSPGTVWVNIDGVFDTATIERVGAAFGIHPLVLEDICHTSQRPKYESYGSYAYVVMRMLQGDPENSYIENEQLSLVLGKSFVLTFQEKQGDSFDGVRDRIRTGMGRLRSMGADFLACTLLDILVDNYLAIIESVGDRIEDIEEELIEDPTHETLRRIYGIKRELIFIRKAVRPLTDVVQNLMRRDTAVISEETIHYLRDVYDHCARAYDSVDTFRDLTTGMMDQYSSTMSQKLNEIMKVLTLIATVFMPLTFIAGVYGMNFEHMPELRHKAGYPAVIGLMILVALGMLSYFRKKKWI